MATSEIMAVTTCRLAEFVLATEDCVHTHNGMAVMDGKQAEIDVLLLSLHLVNMTYTRQCFVPIICTGHPQS